MKNKLFTRMIMLVCVLAGIFNLQAQTTSVVVGTVKNGVGVLTDLTAATKVLLANLPSTAAVSEINLEYSEYDSKYYLTAKVSNDPISSVAVRLEVKGSTIAAFAGPGLEITCTGRNCGDCRPIISKWNPKCVCKSPTSSDYACDMTSKIVITL